MKTVDYILAEKLLKINAIKLQPQNPFTWGSGWTSPIYADNRRTLSYPDVRTFIKLELARMVLERFEGVDAIAGVDNGAIAQGALVADQLALPYAYVRSTPKDHGLENLIEGDLRPGSRVVVIEDLVSTGGSSLKAVEAIRSAGAEVAGILAIFTFNFEAAGEHFSKAGVSFAALTDYDVLIKVAHKEGYLNDAEVELLLQWRQDPAGWALA